MTAKNNHSDSPSPAEGSAGPGIASPPASHLIAGLYQRFGDAVYRARAAGFDGAELHSAHAYTLASFLSRTNPRKDEYGGHTLEGRLHLIGRIMQNIRRKVGRDFPVGVRFLADEFIKDGYTVNDAKIIALRLAELGAAYLSLSVGGKFEDAIHKAGHVPYPYTGYSGDRCMPGDWYPPVPHAHFSAEIKAHLKAHGYDTGEGDLAGSEAHSQVHCDEEDWGGTE